MVDHREFKEPNQAAAQQRGLEQAEQRSRILWIVLFCVLIAAGIFFAFVR